MTSPPTSMISRRPTSTGRNLLGCVKTKKWLFDWAKHEQFARREFDFRALVFQESPRIRVRGRCANSPRSFHTAWTQSGRRAQGNGHPKVAIH